MDRSPKRPEQAWRSELVVTPLFFAFGLMEKYDEAAHINVGTGEDLSIRELAETVRDIVHPSATLTFDTSKPDGMPRKLLDVSRLHALGWRHHIALREGIESTYRWFVEHEHALRTPEYLRRMRQERAG